MTYSADFDILRARFETQWTALHPEIPYELDNDPAVKRSPSDTFVRLSIRPNVLHTASFAAQAEEGSGQVFVQVYVPADQGTDNLTSLADDALSIYKFWTSTDRSVRCMSFRSETRQPTDRDPFYQLSVIGNYTSFRFAPPPPYFDFTASVLPQGATLTRASSANYVNSSGQFQTAGNNVPRFSYDPVSGAFRGLLIEPASTNLLWQSQTLDVAPWGAGGGGSNPSVVANSAVSPDGTANADRIVPGTTAGNQHRTQNATLPAAGTYTLSGYYKAGTLSRCAIGCAANGTFPLLFVELSTASITSQAAALSSASVKQVGNGWYRIAATFSADSSHLANQQHSCAFTNGVNAIGFTGDGVSGGYVWQMQLEAGSTTTSPILTTSSTATRAADALTLNWLVRGFSDGTKTVRYTFDDGSTQDVSTVISGGLSTVPTNLSRTHIQRIEIV